MAFTPFRLFVKILFPLFSLMQGKFPGISAGVVKPPFSAGS